MLLKVSIYVLRFEAFNNAKTFFMLRLKRAFHLLLMLFDVSLDCKCCQTCFLWCMNLFTYLLLIGSSRKSTNGNHVVVIPPPFDLQLYLESISANQHRNIMVHEPQVSILYNKWNRIFTVDVINIFFMFIGT